MSINADYITVSFAWNRQTSVPITEAFVEGCSFASRDRQAIQYQQGQQDLSVRLHFCWCIVYLLHKWLHEVFAQECHLRRTQNKLVTLFRTISTIALETSQVAPPTVCPWICAKGQSARMRALTLLSYLFSFKCLWCCFE